MTASVILLAAVLVGLQVAIIWGLGAWTLVLYRSGRLHDAQAKTTSWTGLSAVLADVVFAALVTFCGCMTQPVVFAFQRAGAGVRAVRFLALSSALRATMVLAVFVSGASLRLLVPLLIVTVLWAELLSKRLASGTQPIAPSAVFTRRRSDAPVTRALSDSWQETLEMLRRYAPHLVVPTSVAAFIVVLRPDISWDAWSPGALALGAAVIGALMPLDLVALLPLLAALSSVGAPAVALLPLALGTEVGSVRSRRVATGYLRPELRDRYASLARLLPWLAAIVCAVLG